MKDKVRLRNHPVHPMLIPLPIGLWVFALVADIIFRVGGNTAWSTVAYYSMAGGIVGAVIAAIPGLLDYLDLPLSRTKDIARRHMFLNITAVVLFSWNFSLREAGVPVGMFPFILSIIGVLTIMVSGWLGGHMVYVHGMAVDETEVCAPQHSTETLHRAGS